MEYAEPSALDAAQVYSPGGGLAESSADGPASYEGPPPLVRNTTFDTRESGVDR